eukprot:1474610-Alexandrium_andersonii.AAC.1
MHGVSLRLRVSFYLRTVPPSGSVHLLVHAMSFWLWPSVLLCKVSPVAILFWPWQCLLLALLFWLSPRSRQEVDLDKR